MRKIESFSRWSKRAAWLLLLGAAAGCSAALDWSGLDEGSPSAGSGGAVGAGSGGSAGAGAAGGGAGAAAGTGGGAGGDASGSGGAGEGGGGQIGSCSATGSTGSAYERVVCEDRPVAYYHFNESPLAEAVKSLVEGAPEGKWLDGVPPVSVPGAVEGDAAFQFAGVEEQEHGTRIFFGDAFDFIGTSDFSVEMWVKPSAGALGDEFQHLFSKKEVGGSGYSLELSDSKNTSDIGSLKNDSIEFKRFSSAGDAGYNYSSDKLLPPAGEFLHLVVTLSGANVVLYINGFQANAIVDFDNTKIASSPGQPFVVGNSADSGVAFAGAIDELAVYDKVLRREAVCRHYYVGKGLDPDENCAL